LIRTKPANHGRKRRKRGVNDLRGEKGVPGYCENKNLCVLEGNKVNRAGEEKKRETNISKKKKRGEKRYWIPG